MTRSNVPDADLIVSAEKGFFLPINISFNTQKRECGVVVVMEMAWLWSPKRPDANKACL